MRRADSVPAVRSASTWLHGIVPATGAVLPGLLGLVGLLVAAPPASAVTAPAHKAKPAVITKTKAKARPAAAPKEQAPSEARAPHLLDGVVAVVDGDPITLRDLKRYAVTDAPFLPPDVRGDYRALLNSMIEHRLLRAEFEKNGITASDEMVNSYIAGVLSEQKQTRAQLEIDIAKAGLSWKDYFERMREEVERIQLVNLLIRSRVNVPEEEVRRVWENEPGYLESEKLEVGVIFLPNSSGESDAQALEQAEKVRKEARSDFEDAAKKYSKLPSAEDGHLGEFKRGTMASHIEKALVGLKEGEVSEPVAGPGGYFIVKLIDIKASGRKPFEDVKEELTDKLYDQRLNERYQKWATNDLRKDHRVDILLDKLAMIAADTASPPPATVPSTAPALTGSAPAAPATTEAGAAPATGATATP